MMSNKKFMSDGFFSVALIFCILLIDQVLKVYIKTSMMLGESIHITDWFYIDFVENPGMAYGMTFINKLVLSLLRIVVISVICFYLHKVIKQGARLRYVLFLSMIVAGAIGNIVDSMFYGLIFSESTPFSVATLVPFGTGYEDFLKGKVVDMFYFPIVQSTYPNWFPFKGGEDFIFFSPVFNFADACISVGVVCLLLFCRKDLESLSLYSSKSGVKE